MSAPIILLPTPRLHSMAGKTIERYAIGFDYVNTLVEAGANPLLMPVNVPEASARRMYALADGVLLAGGPDCDPDLFGEPKHEKTSAIDDDRDSVEIWLTRWALADDKPLLGICRGMQMMNVAMGGSLIQDIPSQQQSNLEHQGGDWATRDQVLHDVALVPGSQIARIIGLPQVGVNSFHHQAVKRLATGFEITARAPDGVIEAFEHRGRRFALGVQWHPENLAAARRSEMLALFTELVSMCTPRA